MIAEGRPVSTNISKSGPITWRHYHAVAYAYSDAGSAEQRAWARQFLGDIANQPLCSYCQQHANANVDRFKLNEKLDAAFAELKPPADPGSVFAVTWELHNFVNAFLEKPQVSLEFAVAQLAEIESTHGCSIDAMCEGGITPVKEVEHESSMSKNTLFWICIGLGILCIILIVCMIVLGVGCKEIIWMNQQLVSRSRGRTK